MMKPTNNQSRRKTSSPLPAIIIKPANILVKERRGKTPKVARVFKITTAAAAANISLSIRPSLVIFHHY